MKLFLRMILLIELSAEFSETGIHRRPIRVTPSVAVTLINDSTYFNCSTTSEQVEWLYISDENLHQSIIYSYGTVKASYQARFRVQPYDNKTETQFNLVLQSVTKDDSGRYICQVSDDGNEEGEVQLIVLETEPICESNMNVGGLIGPNSCAIKPETLQLSCSVRYSGHQAPILQWMKNGENVAINSSICSASGNVYTCNLTMETELQMEGSSYVCHTTQSTAKQYSCTSGVVRIIYAFDDHPELKRTINEKVNCSINSSSHSCTWSWIFDNGTANWTESHEREIEFKRPGRYICEAICAVGNNNCTFTAMTVNVTAAEEPQVKVAAVCPTDHQNPILTIVVCIVGALVISIVVFILLVFYHRWNKKRQKRQSACNSDADQKMLEDEPDGGKNIFRPMKAEHLNRRVRGLTILNDELFVTFKISDIIEIFPFVSNASERSLKVEDLSDPGTIAACSKNNCLYIMDQRRSDPKKKIFRINPEGTIIKTWMTDDGDRGRISVNHEGNVIMTVYDKHMVKMYSLDGTLIPEKTIDLSETKIDYINYTINLTDGHFILCQGIQNKESKLHRVCKVDCEGNILQSFGNERGSDKTHLSSPVHLAERNDGSILVADQGNHRIILLNSDLEFMKELRTKENDAVSLPEAVCIYEKTNPSRLFLGCNKVSSSDGYVLDLVLSQSTE